LRLGISPLRRNPKTGQDPIHVAARRGNAELVALLLKAGADAAKAGNGGETPIDIALASRNIGIADALIAGGAKLDRPDARLHTAINNGQTDLVRWLLLKGIPPGPAVLHDAALKGHIETIRLLIENGASVTGVNDGGATALHDAALAGHAAAVDLLLAKGAVIDARDSGGRTPLFLAASWGRRAAVELLLERGASKLTRDNSGKSPREAALENSHKEVAEALR